MEVEPPFELDVAVKKLREVMGEVNSREGFLLASEYEGIVQAISHRLERVARYFEGLAEKPPSLGNIAFVIRFFSEAMIAIEELMEKRTKVVRRLEAKMSAAVSWPEVKWLFDYSFLFLKLKRKKKKEEFNSGCRSFNTH